MRRALACSFAALTLALGAGAGAAGAQTTQNGLVNLNLENITVQIPVGLAFLFHNSVQGRMIAFYPSPAGATESELSLDALDRMVEHSPELAVLLPDVEALLVRRSEGSGGSCYLVPIDACYELVGRLRMVWRGFDGGQEAHEAMKEFFQRVEARSRPAPAVESSGPTT